LGEEDEGGKAVLGASSERVGVAPSSGERRRPWRELAGTHGRKRRVSQGGKEKGGKEREGCVACREGLQGVLLLLEAASRRCPAAAQRRTRRCFQLEEEEDGFFWKTP
jgi:hypothetical protein